MYIEMKRPDHANKPTEDQKDWLNYFNRAGYRAVVCYGYEEAVREIQRNYGVPEFVHWMIQSIMRCQIFPGSMENSAGLTGAGDYARISRKPVDEKRDSERVITGIWKNSGKSFCA